MKFKCHVCVFKMRVNNKSSVTERKIFRFLLQFIFIGWAVRIQDQFYIFAVYFNFAYVIGCPYLLSM